MKTINQACVELSIDPSAFRNTLRCAIELAEAQKALSLAIQNDFDALRAEGLTDEEEQKLKVALKYTIGK